MDLQECRVQIDEIDSAILELFQKRMKVAEEVARNKREKNLPILDMKREREKLTEISQRAEEGMQDYTRNLFNYIMQLSRTYQGRLNYPRTGLADKIEDAIKNTDPLFPKNIAVACQGVEGAYSQLACDRLFGEPNIMYFNSFEGVFAAIEKRLCQYGVLPIENSTAGSVNQIYDLMMRYKFRIVRSVRLKVDHSLLAKKGTKLEDIKEIFSHEQAISQSGEFLHTLKDVKITVCENTAMAAKLVAESGRTDIGAIASHSCAKIYGLECLCESIQDKGNNYTRFICISRDVEIYPGADRTSIMITLPHKPGALYQILSCFNNLGINLVKIESRPLPDRDFEFMFYFDIETSVYSKEFIQLIIELEEMSENFRYLGSYSELI